MSHHVAWQVELTVKPAELADFRALTAEMVAVTRTEPGVLIYERYADAAAGVAHLHTFVAQFGARFSSLVDRQRFMVLGVPSAELKAILDQFGATYLAPLDGFSNCGA